MKNILKVFNSQAPKGVGADKNQIPKPFEKVSYNKRGKK